MDFANTESASVIATSNNTVVDSYMIYNFPIKFTNLTPGKVLKISSISTNYGNLSAFAGVVGNLMIITECAEGLIYTTTEENKETFKDVNFGAVYITEDMVEYEYTLSLWVYADAPLTNSFIA